MKGELKLFSAVMGLAWSPVGQGRRRGEEKGERGEEGRKSASLPISLECNPII